MIFVCDVSTRHSAYFSDAPYGSSQFVYIQKLYELGITGGTVGPTINSSGVLTAQGQFAPASTLVNYQIAIFLDRARSLADYGCTAAYYAGALKPFPVSSNANCSPNASITNSTEAPYFNDVCSPTQTFSNCPHNPSEAYFNYVQRLGDLNVFQSPSSVIGYPTCGSCVFGENTTILRSQMAIWTVTGMGLVPESVLNINTPTGPNVWSTLPTITVPFTFTAYNQTQASAVWGQFLLQSSSAGDAIQGPVFCSGGWATATLNLYDPAPGQQVTGYDNPLADTFCTVSLVSVASLPNGNGTQATVNFTFAPSAQGVTYNVFHEVVYSVGQDPWENVGTLTVQASSNPTATITDTTQSNGYYSAGDNFTLVVTGPPNAGPPNSPPIQVIQNGGSLVTMTNAQNSSSTNSQGVWTTTGTWAQTDVGDYTQTYYVAGVAAPGLAFQVRSGAAPVSCGTVTAQSVVQGTAEPLQVSNVSTPPGSTATVTFAITGENVNPYNVLANATVIPGSVNSTWSTPLPTGNLLGEYQAAASVQVTNPNGSTTTAQCTNAVLFRVSSPFPANPGQAACASMTGTWTDALPAGNPPFTWNLTDSGGSVTGSASAQNSCGTSFTWSTVSGNFSPSTGQYSLTASGGYPLEYFCGQYLSTVDQTISGTIQWPQCGLSTDANHIGGVSYTDTLTTERIPASETSAFVSWGDAYGLPTASIFKATLNNQSGGPAYNFGGRTVTEGVPTSPAGSDTCWWAGNDFNYKPVTHLATTDTWYVQNDQKNGSYGVDYVGPYPAFLTLLQKTDPVLMAPPYSCTIQYPQQMSINAESSTGSGSAYATNMLVFTITQTTVSVSRGGAADPAGARAVHF